MASVYGAGSIEPRTRKPSKSRAIEDTRRSGARAKPSGKGRNSSPRLAELIEQDIIPRLLVAHPAATVSADSGAVIEPEDAARFAPLPLSLEADELLARVDQFLARGVPAESIFIDLLAPSARKLGEYWEEDRADFVEVTMGLWRLQEVMREVARRSPAIGGLFASPRSALFAPMPGEQHSFGTTMVEECFTRAGWDTELLLACDRDMLLDRLGERSYDLAGLTLSCDCHIDPVSSLIRAMRSVSRNSGIRIMIGGRVANDHPSIAIDCGADGTAKTASDAVMTAEDLVPVQALQTSLTS